MNMNHLGFMINVKGGQKSKRESCTEQPSVVKRVGLGKKTLDVKGVRTDL